MDSRDASGKPTSDASATSLGAASDIARFSESFDVAPAHMLEAARFEGVIAKREATG